MNPNLAAVVLAIPLAGAQAAPQPDWKTIKVHETDRSYLLHRPAKLAKDVPAPLVLVLHGGAQGNAAPGERSKYRHFDALADQHGFVVAYPDSKNNSRAGRGSWASQTSADGSCDVDFLSQLIDFLKSSENCGAVFMTGMSAGGTMTYTMACEAPGKLTAVAIGAGKLTDNKRPTKPLPVLHICGTADKGAYPGTTNAKGVYYPGARETVDLWRQMNGLADVEAVVTFPENSRMPQKVKQERWSGKGPSVVLVSIEGMGHAWPNPENSGVDGDLEVWKFFSSVLEASRKK